MQCARELWIFAAVHNNNNNNNNNNDAGDNNNNNNNIEQRVGAGYIFSLYIIVVVARLGWTFVYALSCIPCRSLFLFIIIYTASGE